MGMFDFVRSSYRLGPTFTDVVCQTKDIERTLGGTMSNYWIDPSGQLWYIGCDHVSDFQEIGEDDEVIVTSRTFLASVSSIVNAGATPVFADVSPDSQNITSESISKVLSKKTKAIVCVHYGGLPCDMDELIKISRKKSKRSQENENDQKPESLKNSVSPN